MGFPIWKWGNQEEHEEQGPCRPSPVSPPVARSPANHASHRSMSWPNRFEVQSHRSRTRSSQSCSPGRRTIRSEEHTSELQSIMRISYAVFCLKKKNNIISQI